MVATIAAHTGIPPASLLGLDGSMLLTIADVLGSGSE